MFFKIFTLAGKITSVHLLDFSSDNGYVYSLGEVIRICWSRDCVISDPFTYGKRIDPFGVAGQEIDYIVEADKWSIACKLVETLIDSESKEDKK